MTDVVLKNPIVTAVLAIKNGDDISPVSLSQAIPVEVTGGVYSTTAIQMIDADNTEFIMRFTADSSTVIVTYEDFNGDLISPTLPIKTIEKKLLDLFSTSSSASKSGTITTGGTSQLLMAANTARKGWSVQNLSTGDLWINLHGGAASAAQPSRRLFAGDMYVTQIGEANGSQLNIFGATTGQAYQAEEW